MIHGLPAFAAAVPHADPIIAAVQWLAVILIAAKLGGDLAVRVGQPSVLGELLAGVALGNLHLLGYARLEGLKTDPAIELLASLGVLLLLFEVGLESTVGQMLKVGASSLLVALLGVAAPFLLGWGVGAWLLPDRGIYVHLFLGATLTATSIGITARVLKDLGRSQSPEARVILGAAVVDDVLGLALLSMIAGLIGAADSGARFGPAAIALPLVKSLGFLVGAIALGVLMSRRLFRLASRLRSEGVLLAIGLAFCFLLSWLAARIGLAPIVGAFAAGLILEEDHAREFAGRGEKSLEDHLAPLTSFLAPVFFVLMGARTDLAAFARPESLGLAAALTVAAILGKQACAFGVLGGAADRLSVGIGMIPRGEVGLIFANIGLALSVAGRSILDRSTYSAIVVMVVVTTMAAPPALRWSLGRRRPEDVAGAGDLRA